MNKASEMLEQLVLEIELQTNLIVEELDGEKIGAIKRFLLESKFELNPTKRKLIEIIEDKVSSKINEQKLVN